MKRMLSGLLAALGIFTVVTGCFGLYTLATLAAARSTGAYPSAEAGMLANAERYYSNDRQVKILYAGTNSFDGSKPHIWYVIAEIHASARANGSKLGKNNCDAPGSFFLQTRDGNWVHVSEGAFPTLLGFWMEVFGLAGEGQSTPSTNWAPGQPARFCLQ